jgi:hypothetical protein
MIAPAWRGAEAVKTLISFEIDRVKGVRESWIGSVPTSGFCSPPFPLFRSEYVPLVQSGTGNATDIFSATAVAPAARRASGTGMLGKPTGVNGFEGRVPHWRKESATPGPSPIALGQSTVRATEHPEE